MSDHPGGVVCPLATPLTGEGALNETALRDLIEALLPDLDGLFVLGSSGELTWLPDEVAVRVLEVAAEQVDGRIPLYVGVGDTSTARTLLRMESLAEHADYLVVTAPFYYQIDSDDQLAIFFETIADRSPRPIVLYNIPQNTHNFLAPSVVARIADHENIVGMKDSAGDPFVFAEYLALRSDSFSVMQGREQLMAQSYCMGADGLISALANLAPRLLKELQTAIRSGAPSDDVLELQSKITALARVFDEGYWLSALKAALSVCGFDVGDPSRPLPPASPEARRRIADLLDTVGGAWVTRRKPA